MIEKPPVSQDAGGFVLRGGLDDGCGHAPGTRAGEQNTAFRMGFSLWELQEITTDEQKLARCAVVLWFNMRIPVLKYKLWFDNVRPLCYNLNIVSAPFSAAQAGLQKGAFGHSPHDSRYSAARFQRLSIVVQGGKTASGARCLCWPRIRPDRQKPCIVGKTARNFRWG